MKRITRAAATFTAASTVAVAALLGPAHAGTRVECPGTCATPPPTGPHAVGRADVSTDSTMVTAWYPAVTGTGAAAALLEPATAAALSEGFGLPDLSGLSTYARTDARPKPGARRPVVVLSPGYGLVSELYSSTAEDLGSHGWVVLGVDAGPEDPTSLPTEAQLHRRTAALRGVLEALAAQGHPLGSSVDLDRVGALGHSFGGAAALNALGTGPIRAAVNLDGSVFGDVVVTGARGPALLISSQACLDPTQQALAVSSGPNLQVRQMVGTTHYSFTDIVHFGGDAAGSLDAAAVSATQRRMLLRWFHDTVSSQRSASPRLPTSAALTPVTGPCA
jgi:dienelactone hydrolase